jgi:hypothetical protein
MATNRWIGQAVPRVETRYYIPDSITAGDRFQLSYGADRFAYTYPEVPPEADVTADDRAQRVVDAIVELATSGSTAALGGGAIAELTYSSSNWGGKPAIKIDGPSDGAPIGVIPTVTPSSTNQINVQQIREGSSGKDFIFTLTWPTVPSAGKWAIAANGCRPIILDWNVSAANLRTAILTFNLPVTTVTVTGSHSAGYVVTFAGLTDVLPDQPVMFPVVPTPGQAGILAMKFLESETYRFGPEVTGSAAVMLASVFDSDISEAAMITYLSASTRLGALANDVTVTRTAGTAAQDWATYAFTFTTQDAFDAFQAMKKERLVYDWETCTNYTPETAGFRNYRTNSGTMAGLVWHKTRQKPRMHTSGSDTLNPNNRNFYTKTYIGIVPSDTMLTSAATGALNGPLSQVTGIITATDLSVVADTAFIAGVTSWNLLASDVAVAIGSPGVWTPFNLEVSQNPAGTEIGVNNNAGYTVETIGNPGITNQIALIPNLDGNYESLYRFEWNGKRSHLFSGASGVTLIKDAAESIWGAGNVSVSSTSQTGYLCSIEFVSKQSEREIVPTLVKTNNTADTQEVAISVTSTTPMQPWVLRYRFTGGVCSGTWRFVDHTGAVFSTTTPFNWLAANEITETDIRAAIASINADYVDVLSTADIAITTEQVGRRYILREFTITWNAQPSAWFSTADLPFWLGIDTASLKTAEPAYAATQIGAPAVQESQLVSLRNKPTSGTFTLTLGGTTTGTIAYNASAATVQSALTTAGIGVTVVGGTGGPYRVRWTATGAQALLVGNSSLGKTNTPTFSTVIAAGTGPKHYNNVDNWSLGVLPADTDVIVFSDGSVDCCYALTVSTVLPAGIDIYRSYTGRIGLPEIRDDGSNESLPNWLTFTGTSTTAMVIRAGLGESGEGPTNVRISVTNRPVDCSVLKTQTGNTQKVFGLKCADTASKMTLVSGDAALGIRPEDVANVAVLQILPPTDTGDGASFSSSAASVITTASILGGSAVFGSPPANLRMVSGDAVVYGTGDCRKIDLSKGARVRWMAGGKIGLSGTPSAILFGPSWTSSSSTAVAVRFTQTAHGLASGTRIYVRAYSGVHGLDGRVFAITVIDSNTFELLGSAAFGTLTGYTGLVQWGVAQPGIIRDDCVLDFDSDGRSRDIVAPLSIQGTGIVSDKKVSVNDLRLWPELVEDLAFLGQGIELRRYARSTILSTAEGGSGGVSGGGGGGPSPGGGGGGGGMEG